MKVNLAANYSHLFRSKGLGQAQYVISQKMPYRLKESRSTSLTKEMCFPFE